MPEFTLTLPMPPSVNALYIGRGTSKRKHPNYAAWSDEAGWRINEERAAGRFSALTAKCWYWTDVRLPANHIGDSDNRLKALHDLLHKMHATPDDQWLLGGTYMRCAEVASGTCIVHARSVPNGPVEVADQARFLATRLAPEIGDWKQIGAVAREMVRGTVK
ncbi:hypothetical protein P6F26_16730 [Roseibacterium sp. SDUM158017]|uniref:hypothetical protein n=1 Tax=Roseicyclus salinarum TaxID=3036773 RepID=UPI002414EB91|nr:hypothetical protein [Roseibacterium sp. SDUM158017]MDG4650095.1 hypothetical protein [Roseibacterium sp. SDUM158017]